MKTMILCFLFFAPALISCAQDKCTQVLGILDKVKDACEAYPPQDYCNIFVGQAISDLYNVGDFKSSSSGTGFYDANTILLNLFTNWSDKWENLGTCEKQEVLSQAQNSVNSNRCVIAVWRNPDPQRSGHICLILPGNLSFSTAWNLNVPNAANFAKDAPNLNFVCSRLSGAFGPEKKASTYLFVKK